MSENKVEIELVPLSWLIDELSLEVITVSMG